MARNRYWVLNKSGALHNVQTSLNYLEDIFAQESEKVVSTDLIEVEGVNMISCPPHFVKLIHAIKILKEIERGIENNDFVSLAEENKD